MENNAHQHARVLSVDSGMAQIELICKEEKVKHDGKPHCGACGMFKTGDKRKIVAAHNEAGAAPGDVVKWSLEEGAQLKASLILFLFPLVVFILATAIVTSLGMRPALIFLISFMSLAITLLGLKLV